jgi:NAD dependent epimerase/dehydratase family enzyme
MDVKKIVIAGGTGHLGSSLTVRLIQEGHSVRLLTREVPKNNSRIAYSYWDGETLGTWVRDLEGSDVLINLCGKSVDCRYTQANKLKLINSRVKSTTLLGQAIAEINKPPSLWINSSSSAYYGFSEKL